MGTGHVVEGPQWHWSIILWLPLKLSNLRLEFWAKFWKFLLFLSYLLGSTYDKSSEIRSGLVEYHCQSFSPEWVFGSSSVSKLLRHLEFTIRRILLTNLESIKSNLQQSAKSVETFIKCFKCMIRCLNPKTLNHNFRAFSGGKCIRYKVWYKVQSHHIENRFFKVHC